MRKEVRARGVIAVIALFATTLACGSAADSGDGGSTGPLTFSCGSLECTSGRQYCLRVEAAPPAYSCNDLPAGCATGMWCQTCLASVPNTQSCGVVTIDGVTDIEVVTVK